MRKLLLLLLLHLSLFAVASMHPKTYEGINQANTFIEEKAYDKARKVFDELIANTSNKRSYDLAFIYNASAYLYIQENNYTQAINVYEKALSFEVLPQAMANSIIYTLAQLSLQEQEYKASIAYLKKWHAQNEATLGSSKLLMVVHLSLDQTVDALEWCKKAIKLSLTPDLPLYQNQLALQLKLDQVNDAIESLLFIIEHFEITKSYYTQLSYLYQRIGEDKKSVGILESAYQMGLLTKYEERLQLAQMLNYTGATIKAIPIVKTLLDDPEHKVKTLEYLAQLQLTIKEYAQAIATLQTLYKINKEQKNALILAQLFASNAQWDLCETYVRKITTDQGKLLLAIALAEQKKTTQAVTLFKELEKEKGFKKEAHMWLEHLRQ